MMKRRKMRYVCQWKKQWTLTSSPEKSNKWCTAGTNVLITLSTMWRNRYTYIIFLSYVEHVYWSSKCNWDAPLNFTFGTAYILGYYFCHLISTKIHKFSDLHGSYSSYNICLLLSNTTTLIKYPGLPMHNRMENIKNK
jgi:hypothetical protein